MRALRGIGIVMVFIVAGTLFSYLAFVHPIGTQFVRGKVTKVVTEAKKIVKEQIQPAPMEPAQAPIDAQPPVVPVVAKKQGVPKPAGPAQANLAPNGVKPPRLTSPRKTTAVTTTKPRSRAIDNPFKLERTEFSRADIDSIIEQRRRIKDKLGEL